MVNYFKKFIKWYFNKAIQTYAWRPTGNTYVEGINE